MKYTYLEGDFPKAESPSFVQILSFVRSLSLHSVRKCKDIEDTFLDRKSGENKMK